MKMDACEATRIVFSRIQTLDPENASKIMGLLLIQDHGEKEMIRLAFGPETLVHSVVLKARKELGLNSPTNSSSPSSPSPLFASNPLSISRQSSTSSRLGFSVPPSLTIPNPSSSNSSSSWSALSDLPNPDHELVSPSGSSLNPASLPFYANGAGSGGVGGGSDLIDGLHLQDQFSFLNENSPNLGPKSADLFYPPQLDSLSSPTGAGSDSMLYPSSYWGGSPHRRSCSVSDVLGADDPNCGFGWRPCLYFARGYCKNGSNCRFVHGGVGDAADGSSLVGSPNKIEMMDQCHELLRSKSAQQQRLAAAAQLMGSASSFLYSPKCMNFLLQQQQNDSPRAAAATAALMMGEDLHKLGRSRLDRNDFVNPASRQIYLTFPADSTFREEDVSNYFSIYGPVQDVRIPYQQKRMFGFVTFVYPETVKQILAKGNPHFVCDARVLVKPYKEKGKVPDKKQPQGEREFSPCGTPTGLDSRDPFDLQLGGRIFYNNTQDILWRRKLEEQADLQQALELQSRRLMGLQLLDGKKHHHHRALSTGSPIPSPTHSTNFFNQSVAFPRLHSSTEVAQENGSTQLPVLSMAAPPEKQTPIAACGKESSANQENGSGKEFTRGDESDLQESLEHNLPDSPFASPTNGSSEYYSAFTNGASEPEKVATVSASSTPADNNLVTPALIPASSSLDMSSFKSFNCQMPRFSSGPGGIGMCAGTGGPTCPVGI